MHELASFNLQSFTFQQDRNETGFILIVLGNICMTMQSGGENDVSCFTGDRGL